MIEHSWIPPIKTNIKVTHKPKAAPHASNKFLSILFWTFFNWTQPAHSMAKPACMKKTRHAAQSKKKVSMLWPCDSCWYNKRRQVHGVRRKALVMNTLKTLKKWNLRRCTAAWNQADLIPVTMGLSVRCRPHRLTCTCFDFESWALWRSIDADGRPLGDGQWLMVPNWMNDFRLSMSIIVHRCTWLIMGWWLLVWGWGVIERDKWW